jgi:gas vesicle protein
MAVGMVVGGFLGGVAGLAVAPFKGVGHAVSTQNAQKNVQTWNFTESLKAVR